MTSPSCQPLLLLLSAYVDGELLSAERKVVDDHLGSCPACTLRISDLRAQTRLVRAGLEEASSTVDFVAFQNQVMARLAFRKPSWGKRARLYFQERPVLRVGAFSAALAGCAAAAVLVFASGRGPEGYANPGLTVRMVTTDAEAHVAPVVIKADNGDAIIWLVQHPHDETTSGATDSHNHDEPGALQRPERPKGGDL